MGRAGFERRRGRRQTPEPGGFLARHGRLVQVELEALPPEILRDLLAAELDQIVDTSMSEAMHEREERERQQLAGLARSLRERT